MQKNWLQVFLLCVSCMICLHGNCAAEKWVQYYNESNTNCFLDLDSVRTLEYSGRKYLEVTLKMDSPSGPNVDHYTFHQVYNIEMRRGICLEAWIENYLLSRVDISSIIAISPADSWLLSNEAALQWVEQNRPDIIKEIRTFNGNNTPSAGTQTVTADGDYGFVQTLGDGPVQYVPRSLHRAPTHPVPSDSIVRYYVSGVPANGIITRFDYKVPPIAPFSSKPLYILYTSRVYHSLISNTIIAIFSYDDATNTFTLYPESLSSMEYDVSRPLRKIHIIDKDTVEGIYWDDETYSEDNPLTLQFKYIKALPGYNADMDGCAWTGWDLENDIHAPIDVYFVGNFGASNLNLDYGLVYWDAEDELGLDGLFAFLAHKGKVGYAPAGPNVEYWAKVPH